MNTVMARHLAAKIAELIELSSIFQSRYGKDYRLKPGSPADAWNLHQAIFEQQSAIAGLLDAEALENPLQRTTEWWQRQEVVDTALVGQMAQEAYHLISCCACREANPESESPIVKTSQRVIAGMLHPSTRLMAMAKAS